MHKYFPILVIGWTVMIACALLSNLYILHRNSEALVQTRMETFFKLLVTTRQWNASHGLVYVPVTGAMRPNPYLIHNRRDVVTNYGDSLTLVNPAFMTRQLAELSEKNNITGFHITSLNPIRPANKPDAWETKALKTFETADDKYFEKIKTSDSITFRYMASLVVGQSCLACHASQGYKLGDIRGGISINTLYHKDYIAFSKTSTNKLIIIFALIYLMGALLLLYFRSVAKRYATEVQARDKDLREIIAEKDKFFSVIAHDLKTPAANIKSLSETLNERFADLGTEERKNCLEMLVESANIHNNMLNTMLDLSRVRIGSKLSKPERLNIPALVDEVLEQTKLQAQQKQISQANHVVKCFAKADKNMIITVVRNIVVNAIKFTYPSGQIVVNAESVDAEIIVSIADTGVGIDPDLGKRIFEVDYNKSTTGTANESGTGLGLVLCKEYVERNNGRIWFESKNGVGSTFFFTLPADM